MVNDKVSDYLDRVERDLHDWPAEDVRRLVAFARDVQGLCDAWHDPDDDVVPINALRAALGRLAEGQP